MLDENPNIAPPLNSSLRGPKHELTLQEPEELADVSAALAANSAAPFAFWPVAYRADGGTDTRSFDQPVKAAYAVMRNLSNSGSSGDTNSMSAFTCSGLNVSVDTDTSDDGTSVVSTNWAREKSKWKGKDLQAWNSAVDHLIIVEFGAPDDADRSGNDHSVHGKSD